MASGRLLLSKSWVIELDPLHSVERRLMVVDTVALVVAFVAVEASTDVLSGPPLADTFTEELSRKFIKCNRDQNKFRRANMYRVTRLLGNNLLLTWIWKVLPSCLGSR